MAQRPTLILRVPEYIVTFVKSSVAVPYPRPASRECVRYVFGRAVALSQKNSFRFKPSKMLTFDFFDLSEFLSLKYRCSLYDYECYACMYAVSPRRCRAY
jgi:hypothetical protein